VLASRACQLQCLGTVFRNLEGLKRMKRSQLTGKKCGIRHLLLPCRYIAQLSELCANAPRATLLHWPFICTARPETVLEVRKRFLRFVVRSQKSAKANWHASHPG
jgi:hypothetical protein